MLKIYSHRHVLGSPVWKVLFYANPIYTHTGDRKRRHSCFFFLFITFDYPIMYSKFVILPFL